MKDRVVIIGGGVIGWCSAYFANEAGFKVTVIERDGLDTASASCGNSGLIVPSHVIPLAAPGMVRLGMRLMLNKRGPFGFRFGANPFLWGWAWRFMRSCSAEHVYQCAPILADLHLQSKQLYLDFTKRLKGFDVDQLGLLSVCRYASTLVHEQEAAHLAEGLGIKSEVISGGDALNKLDPSLSKELAGAVWFKDDAHLDPGKFLASLRSSCIANGVTVVEPESAQSFRREEDRITSVRCKSGAQVEGDHFVLAAGTWSRELAASVGLNAPVIGGKGHSLNLESPPGVPRLPMILVEARAAITPLGSILRIGGTMELGPSDPVINPNRVQGIRDSIPQFLPHIPVDHLVKAPIWAGLRPVTPDGMPLLGRTRVASNFIVATGHAMMGQSLGPISGRLVCELLEGSAPSVPLHLMAPDRFS